MLKLDIIIKLKPMFEKIGYRFTVGLLITLFIGYTIYIGWEAVNMGLLENF